MNFRPRRRPAGGFVDMTPFVDTIFNLLIFFALSMNFLVNPGITVDLPDASAPQVARQDDDIRIVITPAGEDPSRRRAGDAAGASRTAWGDGWRRPRRAGVDPGGPPRAHGLVVAVMDAARSAGLTRLAIMTERK